MQWKSAATPWRRQHYLGLLVRMRCGWQKTVQTIVAMLTGVEDAHTLRSSSPYRQGAAFKKQLLVRIVANLPLLKR